jgi:hypothetical protein
MSSRKIFVHFCCPDLLESVDGLVLDADARLQLLDVGLLLLLPEKLATKNYVLQLAK